LKVKDRDIIRERLDVSCQMIKRGIKTLVEVWIRCMDERRSTAHPGAGKGCMLGSMAGMVTLGQNTPLYADHHITRYKEKDQRDKKCCLFKPSLS